jgi:hypothetical protein
MVEPQIVISDLHNQPSEGLLKRLFSNKKFVILVVLLLVAETTWAIYALTRPLPDPSVSTQATLPSETLLASATLEGPLTVGLGSSFEVKALIDSKEPVEGVDLVINYDPKVLEISVASPSAQVLKTDPQIQPVFEVVVNEVDSAEGVISYSAVRNLGTTQGPTGSTTLGTITFKALSRANTSISLMFTKGDSKDSNILDQKMGRDILEEVRNLELKIE